MRMPKASLPDVKGNVPTNNDTPSSCSSLLAAAIPPTVLLIEYVLLVVFSYEVDDVDDDAVDDAQPIGK